MARSHRPPAERPPVTAGSSRPSPATRMALKLRKPLICRPFPMAYASGGIAGVGTFPGWLSLAVAPASKGLIPQPVSMSGVQCIAGLEDASRRASRRQVAARGTPRGLCHAAMGPPCTHAAMAPLHPRWQWPPHPRWRWAPCTPRGDGPLHPGAAGPPTRARRGAACAAGRRRAAIAHAVSRTRGVADTGCGPPPYSVPTAAVRFATRRKVCGG
jgi:hypothetical protein